MGLFKKFKREMGQTERMKIPKVNWIIEVEQEIITKFVK